ncbi:ComEC/Rec2 family competence protein [Microbacterium sp. BWT-B31]|uniref:ComEC/Rec2 family competence protein n=1 Tax=Microbacterium sp. BWT-B31 TaxID=3232072 RepID=UPI003529AA5F
MRSVRWLPLRLTPVAAASWAAAAAATLVPASAPGLALALWAAALAAIAALVAHARRGDGVPRPASRRWAVVVVLALAAGAAAASNVAFASPARTAVAADAIGGGRVLTIDAVVTGKVERRSDGRISFDAVATAVRAGAGAALTAAEFAVVVRVDPADVDAPEALDVGAAVTLRGTARASDPGERAVLDVSASHGLEVVRPASGVVRIAGQLRRALVDASRGLPQPGAQLVPGLAAGDTSLVAPELDQAMKATSLSHLTAVSGANCALVVGLAFGAAALCGASRGMRVTVALAALGGFVLLVTPEPSVVRAGAMAAIAMLAVALGRAGVGVSLLCLAVAVLVVADPWLSTSLGFALSVAATGALLLFARPLARGMTRWMPRPLAFALAVPLAAQLACGPLLVLIAPSVPVYGVVANLIAGPAAAPATVIGLAACLAAPVPVLASGLAALAWLPAAWIAATATTFASLPNGQLAWAEGWLGLVALAGAGLAVGLVVAARDRRVRVVAGAVLAVVVGVAAGSAAVSGVAGRFTIPPSWAVIACDVGQGDALLVRSAGAIALIDTGPDPAALGACLAKTGVDHVDLLTLTHFDLDHVGGADAVVGRVGTVLHGPTASPADERLLDDLRKGGADVVPASTGLTGTLGDARWRVLWPRLASRAFPSGNDASVVLDVRGGSVPPLLSLGDLSASPQRALVASGEVRPPYAIVKVAHHGSADQDPELYAVAAPAIALIMVGADNDYGHPRAETLAFLAHEGVRVGRTDLEGLVAVSGTRELTVWRERSPPAPPLLGPSRASRLTGSRSRHRTRRADAVGSADGAVARAREACDAGGHVRGPSVGDRRDGGYGAVSGVGPAAGAGVRDRGATTFTWNETITW